MRILAIRGRNLASLEREFEIALDAEPLASAGLFAITGATGAGKSTLLDAMCAALFDRTPRLEGRSPFKVGRGDDEHRVGAFDVRALLRRGAGEGWAEVDFEGKDRRRYRARWEVHRARRKPEGKLQEQQMVLRRLDDGVALGGTRSETARAIEGALGLSFDQFKRSALLAQGEFAAFLRAESGQRASLLERVTGTALYGALSMAAHRRASELAAERRGRLGEVDGAVVLDDDRRAALDVAARAAADELRAARGAVAALGRAVTWCEQVAERAAAEGEARRRWQEATALVAASAGEAQAVARAEAAEAARGPWRARARARRMLDEAERQVREARAAQGQAQGAARQASDAAVAARAARQAHEAEVERLAPAVGRATEVDAALATALAGHDEALAEVSRIEAARAAAEAEVSRRLAASASVGRELDQVEATLAGASTLVAVAADPARWPAVVERAAAVRAGWTRLRAQLDRLVPARHDGEVALDAAEVSVVEARRAHEEARQRAEVAEAAARALPLAPAEQAWASADARARQVEALIAIAVDAGARAATGALLAAEAGEADGVAARAVADGDQARAAGQRAAIELAEARRTLERLQLAASLDHARAALRPGEPCALCGATEHPWAGRAALDDVVVEQGARVDALVAAVADAAGREREAAEVAAVARTRADDRRAAAGREAAAVAARDDDWRRGLAGLGELALYPSPAAVEARRWIGELHAAAAASRDRLAGERARAQAVAAATTAASARALATRHDLEQVERRRDEAAATLRALDEGQRALARDLDELTRERARLDDELAPLTAAVVGLGPRLAAGDADGARGALADALTGVRTLQARAAALRTRLDDERTGRAAAEARRDELGGQGTAAAATARARHAVAAALRAERAGLLEGRTVAEVTAAQRAGSTARWRDEQRAVDVATSAVAAEAAEASRARAAAGQVEAARAALADAERELTHAIATTGLSADELAAVLERDPGWLPAARGRLARLQAEVAEARAVLDERERQRQTVSEQRPAVAAALADVGVGGELLDRPAEAKAALATAGAEADRIAGAVGALAEQLRADDVARARRARASAALAAFDEAALPFTQLDALIGSADGKRLRDFAQSLTLDRLLVAANRHLDELAPRYQLERVGGLDLELQVIDRELGDDVRAVASLSGGESFLVSLALALGLSSLSSSGVEVRTLLIDEGFGSLDLATLETALAALDALRASGRQVGIVSHVPGLDERVPARVVVRALGGGRSAVEIRA